MQKKFRMSQKKYDELRAELEYMKTVRERKLQIRLRKHVPSATFPKTANMMKLRTNRASSTPVLQK